MHSHRRPVLLPVFLVLASLLGCSKQGEGERCLRSNGDADCDSGLVCVASDDLEDSVKNPQFSTDRCCPEDGHFSDSRCALRTVDTTEPDASGPGEGGAAGLGGSANLEGGSPNLEGGSANLEGGSANLEGGSPNLEGGSAGAGG